MTREAAIDYLVSTRRVSSEAVERARAVANRSSQTIEAVLNRIGQLSDEDMAHAYAEVSGFTLWDPGTEPSRLEPSEIGVGHEFLRKVRVVPLRLSDEALVVAACDPFDQDMLNGLRFATGYDLDLRVARMADLREALGSESSLPASAEIDERRLERDMALVEDNSAEGLAVELVTQAFAAAV